MILILITYFFSTVPRACNYVLHDGPLKLLASVILLFLFYVPGTKKYRRPNIKRYEYPALFCQQSVNFNLSQWSEITHKKELETYLSQVRSKTNI